jgi:hypothetical protein
MQPLDDRKLGKRGPLALQPAEDRLSKSIVDGAQPVGAFGVAWAHIVQQAVRMGEKQGRHRAELRWGWPWLDPRMLTREMIE